MKYLFLTLLFLTNLTCFSQKSGDSTEVLVKRIFSKVSPKNYADLVPFYRNNKWGYIDRKTKKILIKPVFNSPQFFHPDQRFYFNGEMVNVTHSGEVKVDKEELSATDVEPASMNISYDPKVRSSRNGFKGFTVSNSGELMTYSDLYQYNTQGIPGWNIQVIKYQGKYYGVVKNLKGEAGVIDTEGNPMQAFEFNYYDIIPNRNTKDTANAWFFVKRSEHENYSLVNTKGEVKFKNEIFNYPLLSSEVFGYTPYSEGDSSAIFDRVNMKWIVKPQIKLRIAGLYFSSQKLLDSEHPENRSQANIYYLVIDKNHQYFMDIMGNKYLPKE